MRLKHNKKRNTAFVYEALCRELTKSMVKNKKDRQNKIISIIKEHFNKNSLLNKELGLYKSIYETQNIEKRLAEKIITEVKQKYTVLNKRELFKEQSRLINSINKTLTNKVFNTFVPNYKNIASVYSIFQDALPVKDRVLLEENLLEHMSSSIDTKTKEDDKKPIDNIVYKTFVERFNTEYSEILSESQKVLLSKYIASFADNGLELKSFLNEEIGLLKARLRSSLSNEIIINDEDIKQKIEKVYHILEKSKEREIDTDLLETVMKTQHLLSEIENANNA